MLSAFSVNEVEKLNARMKTHWRHARDLVCSPSLVPITMCLCSSPRRNLLSLLRNGASIRPRLLLVLLRMQKYFCIMTQPYLFFVSVADREISAYYLIEDLKVRENVLKIQ